MKTYVAKWLSDWAEAPIGTARLVMAAAIFLFVSLTASNAVIQFAAIVWQTSVVLEHQDRDANTNLTVRDGQVHGINARVDHLNDNVVKLTTLVCSLPGARCVTR